MNRIELALNGNKSEINDLLTNKEFKKTITKHERLVLWHLLTDGNCYTLPMYLKKRWIKKFFPEISEKTTTP
jgi:hypothetical protein